MAASLLARSITLTRGPSPVLVDVELTAAPGHRIGVVGPNGVGKSTLLQVLAGRLEPDEGTVERAPRSATVGLLPQETERIAGESVAGFIARRTGVAAAQLALDASTEGLAAGDHGADDAYALALEQWTALGAADLDARTGEVFADLGLTMRLQSATMTDLSGGELARIALASLLLARFDVFLLDEPTNDLDLDALTRLEDWIVGLDAAVVLVSHDRTFLSRAITDVVEIDHHSHRVSRFAGGWDAFLDERERARRHAQERYDRYVEQKQQLLDRSQREREWAAQGRAKVRTTDEPDKNIRAFKLDQTEQLAGRAARTKRMIERLDEVDEPRTPWALRLHLPTVERSGDRVAWTNAAVVERGEFRLGPVDLEIAFGDRVGIVGPNGAGKTTLVDLLLGRIDPDAGRAGVGSGVVLGEVEQVRRRFGGDGCLLAVFTEATEMIDVDARRLLAKFGLGPDEMWRPGATLSPGERTRASLALLMANGANLLVLDEPTNHLDLAAIEQLEVALGQFTGTLLLVSHDRTLLDNVELSRLVELKDGSCRERTVTSDSGR
jgi:ATPase subunit of ABC transporter with duplicated ATPase domains